MVNYQPRVVDSLLRRKLQTIGAVLIEGPKLCGKSTTATMQAKSVLFMEPGRTLQIAALNPKLLLEGLKTGKNFQCGAAGLLGSALNRDAAKSGRSLERVRQIKRLASGCRGVSF